MPSSLSFHGEYAFSRNEAAVEKFLFCYTDGHDMRTNSFLSVVPTVSFITGAALALVTSYFHDKNRLMFVLVLISHTVVALVDSLKLLALEDVSRVPVGNRVYFTPSIRLYSRLKRQS